jgi:HSP20 family molecular chaperone IbpA
MLNKILLSSVMSMFLFGSGLSASDYVSNLNEELLYNKNLIKESKAIIKKLEKRNKYLLGLKKKNPNLYISKPLYENTKENYIYRIKLEGAKAKNLNFTIKNHKIFLEMNLKTEKNDKNGYYLSSQNFYQEFSIPSDVKESKIKNRVDGDYFEIIMPKKI